MMTVESTDYDVDRVGNLDERLEAGKKDAVFFHALGIACTVIATIWMYAFDTGDPAEMKYLLGMPMWVSGAIQASLAGLAMAGASMLAKDFIVDG